MPAAAVIPAPIAYIKVVAVKKLVVGFRKVLCGPPLRGTGRRPPMFLTVLLPRGEGNQPLGSFTLRKLECSKQA